MTITTPYEIERLDFRLHDFTRLVWVSDGARAVWEPRVQRLVVAWLDMEWRAVAAGLRPCALKIIPPEEMPALQEQMSGHNLVVLPLDKVGITQQYAAVQTALQQGQPFHYRVVIGRPDTAPQLQAAWKGSAQTQIGALLGYPACCSAFFDDVWVDNHFVDTTWPMAYNTASARRIDETTLEVETPPLANILLRWLGVRAVPHLPCAFDCPETIARAEAYIQLGYDAGYADEMDWLREMLAWPVAWSALHGIAEIKTPVVKISALTDATPHTYTVRFIGDHYPEEGAVGLSFPYDQPSRQKLTTSRGFQQGLDQPITLFAEHPRPDWHFTDNGFNTAIGMEIAHRPLVAAVLSLVGEEGGSVLDLGCGNGALLETICAAHSGVVPYGIEQDSARLAHVAHTLPDYRANFVNGDLFTTDWPVDRVDVALLMLGRLGEVEAAQAAALVDVLAARARHLVIYAYGDVAQQIGDLPTLAQAYGIAVNDDFSSAQTAAFTAQVR